MKWYLHYHAYQDLGHETKFMYSGLYFTDMELNNFNEYIVVTTDRVKNHQFCCGAFVIPLGVPTSIMGILGLVKLILSLIYSNHLGKRKINRRTSHTYPPSIFKGTCMYTKLIHSLI